MGNLKTADYLSQAVSNEKIISSQENLYEEQIKGKLEVIGLHLHLIRQSIGGTVEPNDFIQEEAKDIDESVIKKSNGIYNLLVKESILQRDTLTKSCNNKAEIIRDNLDPSVAENLIVLLESKREFENSDFENIVCIVLFCVFLV